jgi:hypothetical protein
MKLRLINGRHHGEVIETEGLQDMTDGDILNIPGYEPIRKVGPDQCLRHSRPSILCQYKIIAPYAYYIGETCKLDDVFATHYGASE